MGPEFRVNTYSTGNQTSPSIGMNAFGDFVVTWESYGQDGSGYGAYAQRYTAVGVAVGGEVQVNTQTANAQRTPAVAVDAEGNSVVAWSSHAQDGSIFGVYARRFNAGGMARGPEFLVNTNTTNNQFQPAVDMNAVGDFVVAWASDLQDGSSNGVFAQRYSASGVPLGGEFQVNQITAGSQTAPAVAPGRGRGIRGRLAERRPGWRWQRRLCSQLQRHRRRSG